PASQPSHAWKMPWIGTPAPSSPMRSRRSICGHAPRTVSRRTSCWTSTAPTTPRMERKKGQPTTGTMGSTCIIPCSTSMATPTGQTVRLVAETLYQAGTWDHPRRVVYKAEALDKGPNTRFVVTTRTDAPEALYDWYVDRGAPELWIKDYKRACLADRLSDCRF